MSFWDFFLIICLFVFTGCGEATSESTDLYPKDKTQVNNMTSLESVNSSEEAELQVSDICVDFDYNIDFAETAEDIKAGVFLGETIRYLNLYDTGNGYVLFLPSAARIISFINIDPEAEMKIGDKKITGEQYKLETESWLFEENAFSFVCKEQEIESTIRIMISENIPSVFIDTSVSQEILDGVKGNEYPGSVEIVYENGDVDLMCELDYIRTRGNSTYNVSLKKPYQIKLGKKASVLGMDKAKKWILLSGESDYTYMWNSLVYDFAEEYTTIPGCKGQYVDLYINDVYRGNYYLCQKADSVIDVTDLEEANEALRNEDMAFEFGTDVTGTAVGVKNQDDPEDITGGYLIEVGDSYKANTIGNSYINMGNQSISIRFPDPATVEETAYVKNLFDEIEKAIQASDGINPDTGKHYSEYIDVKSFVDEYLIDCVFMNCDSSNSLYFYKDSDSVDSKVYAGPCWDYDMSYYLTESTDFWITNDFTYLYRDLVKHEEFLDACRERYEELFKPYITYELPTDLYATYSEVKKSFEMNHVLWGNPGLHTTEESFIDTIISKTEQRLRVVEADVFKYETYYRVSYNEGNSVSYFYRLYKAGECIEDYPDAISYVGLFLYWRNEETGEILKRGTPVNQDMYYKAEYLLISDLISNPNLICEIDVDNLKPEQFEYIANYISEQQKNITE